MYIMNRFQKKKSKIIKRYYLELVKFSEDFNMDIPTYCSSKVYFNRILRMHKKEVKRNKNNE